MTLDKEMNGGSRSPIEFRLDPSSGVPTYLQIVQQVEHALRLGYLVTGDRLPKVREVVASLAINPNTVKADDAGLDEDGVVALVTSTLRDFSERRDMQDVRGDQTKTRKTAGGAA